MAIEQKHLLQIDSVSRVFPGVRALENVSFEVAAGEVHGLVGENGAGKSTLMAIASGSLSPSSGSVRIAGTLLQANPEHARCLGLAIVRQEPSLMPDLTVAENIYLGLPDKLRPPATRSNKSAATILKSWGGGVGIHPDDLVTTLNPAQRFIVEICKALASQPQVLVLDEPTEHLAGEDVERLFMRIREVAARGSAVVYISHRLREVQQVADRLTVLRDGRGQGTYSARGLSEQQIVELIVGGTLENEFPAKGSVDADKPEILRVSDLSGGTFKGVTIALRHGEIYGLAGVSDNGQREFLRSLAGLEPITDGVISLNGSTLVLSSSAAAAEHGIRLLPGDRHREALLPELSVLDNFAIRSCEKDARFGVVSSGRSRDRAAKAVLDFRVKTPSIKTRIASLSGGNQQKVILASVLAAKPKVLLIDEPTQGVDVGARAEIYTILREIASRGTAIVVLSSDASEIAGLCDRVAIFSRGQIVAELDAQAVTENNITEKMLTSGSTRDRSRHGVGRIWSWAAGNWAPLAMVAVAIVLTGLYGSSVNEYYFTARNLTGVLSLVATLALVAFGQQLVLLVGGIDLSVGPLMGLVGVVGSFYLTSDNSTGDFFCGFLLMFGVAILAGLINWVLIEPINLHPMVGTLVTYMAFQATSLLMRPSPDGLFDYELMDRIGVLWGPVPASFLVAVVLAVAMEIWLFKTRSGVSLRGLGSQPEAARVVGIRPALTRLFAYIGCSICAALGGLVMLAQVGVGDPAAGTSYTLSSIAAAVIGGASLTGGRGSFVGCLLGAMLINQVNVVATFLGLNDAWQFAFLGIVILSSVAFYSKSRQMIAVH